MHILINCRQLLLYISNDKNNLYKFVKGFSCRDMNIVYIAHGTTTKCDIVKHHNRGGQYTDYLVISQYVFHTD